MKYDDYYACFMANKYLPGIIRFCFTGNPGTNLKIYNIGCCAHHVSYHIDPIPIIKPRAVRREVLKHLKNIVSEEDVQFLPWFRNEHLLSVLKVIERYSIK